MWASGVTFNLLWLGFQESQTSTKRETKRQNYPILWCAAASLPIWITLQWQSAMIFNCKIRPPSFLIHCFEHINSTDNIISLIHASVKVSSNLMSYLYVVCLLFAKVSHEIHWWAEVPLKIQIQIWPAQESIFSFQCAVIMHSFCCGPWWCWLP